MLSRIVARSSTGISLDTFHGNEFENDEMMHESLSANLQSERPERSALPG